MFLKILKAYLIESQRNNPTIFIHSKFHKPIEQYDLNSVVINSKFELNLISYTEYCIA